MTCMQFTELKAGNKVKKGRSYGIIRSIGEDGRRAILKYPLSATLITQEALMTVRLGNSLTPYTKGLRINGL